MTPKTILVIGIIVAIILVGVAGPLTFVRPPSSYIRVDDVNMGIAGVVASNLPDTFPEGATSTITFDCVFGAAIMDTAYKEVKITLKEILMSWGNGVKINVPLPTSFYKWNGGGTPGLTFGPARHDTHPPYVFGNFYTTVSIPNHNAFGTHEVEIIFIFDAYYKITYEDNYVLRSNQEKVALTGTIYFNADTIEPVPSPDPDWEPDTDPEPGDGNGDTTDYAWSQTSLLIAAAGIIAAVLLFAIAPIPPNIKAFISALIVIAAVVAAHFMNTGAI